MMISAGEPLSMINSNSNSLNPIFVRLKRKREDSPLEYLLWNDDISTLDDVVSKAPSKKLKTLNQTTPTKTSPHVFVLAETVNRDGAAKPLKGFSLQNTLSSVDRREKLWNKPRLKEKLAQFMVGGINAFSHQYVDENDNDLQIEGLDKPIISSNALHMLAKSMNSSLCIRDGIGSNDDEAEEDETDDSLYVYDIYYLDPFMVSPIGQNVGTLHMLLDQDKGLCSENEAENEIYDDDDDSNAEDMPQNEYPDEDCENGLDSEGEYYEEEDENTNSGDSDNSNEDEWTY